MGRKRMLNHERTTVSLPKSDIEFLDQWVTDNAASSRNDALKAAIKLLKRESDK